MADEVNYRCNFNIEGTIPRVVFEAFALAQAQLAGVRIWLEEDAKGQICGFLEGTEKTIEKMRAILLKSIETLGNITKVMFEEMVDLKDFAEKTLEEEPALTEKAEEANVCEPTEKF